MTFKLYCRYSGLSAEAWEQAWLDALNVLEAFPSPLLREWDEVASPGGERPVPYTRRLVGQALVGGQGTPTEHWAVAGDEVSGQRAHTVVLYRHLAAQQEAVPDDGLDTNVLWQGISDDAPMSTAADLVGGSTRSLPYTLALMTVGIVLEHHLPGHVFMELYEPVTPNTITRLQAWAGDVLGYRLERPLGYDLGGLWQALVPLYADSPEHTALRFRHLCQLPAGEVMAHVWQEAPQLLNSALLALLVRYPGVEASGAGEWLMEYAEGVQDVEQVITLVKQLWEQPGVDRKAWSLKKLLQGLLRDGITIPPHQKHIVNRMAVQQDGIMSETEYTNRKFMAMFGLSRVMNAYEPPERLLELFAYHDPARGRTFKGMINNVVAKQDGSLKELETLGDNMAEKAMGQMEEEKDWEDSRLRRVYRAEEDWLVLEVLIQQQEESSVNTEGWQQVAQVMAKNIKEVLDHKEDNGLQHVELPVARNMLLGAVSDLREPLPPHIWERLEQEQDKAVLEVLFVLALYPSKTKVPEMRTHFLNHPDLWPYLVIKG